MEETRKCPKCGEEMEKGMVDRGLWVEGEWKGLVKAITGTPFKKKSAHVIAWRCPKCGVIELSSLEVGRYIKD